MKQTGVLWTCDRCRKTEFMAVSISDIQHIELWCHPRDWASVHNMLLCPNCEKIYTKLLEEFLNNK